MQSDDFHNDGKPSSGVEEAYAGHCFAGLEYAGWRGETTVSVDSCPLELSADYYVDGSGGFPGYCVRFSKRRGRLCGKAVCTGCALFPDSRIASQSRSERG